jgi:hypothetical protein
MSRPPNIPGRGRQGIRPIAALYLLQRFGFDIRALPASLGIRGLTVAFAVNGLSIAFPSQTLYLREDSGQKACENTRQSPSTTP